MISILEQLTEEYLCPITRVPLQDHVITEDGHTYERQSILNWLATSQKSPITGLQLSSKNLIPNIALKNLKKKIDDLLPPQLQKIQTLETQNNQLKKQISRLNEQLAYQKEKYLETEEISKKHIKLAKMEEKFNSQKTKDLETDKQEIQKLNNKIREVNRKMTEIKKQNETQKMELTKSIKVLNQKLQNSEKDFQKNLQKFNEQTINVINFLEHSCNKSTQILYLLLIQIQVQVTKSNFQLKKLFMKMDKKIEKYLESENDKKFAFEYKMHKKIVSYLKFQQLPSNSSIILPSVQRKNDLEFFRINAQIDYQHILMIQQSFQKQNISHQEREQFRRIIEGIVVFLEEKTDQQLWQKFIKISEKYPNIQAIRIFNNATSKLEKKDLQKFTKLKYINFDETQLNLQSEVQMNEYANDHPNVVVDRYRYPVNDGQQDQNVRQE